MNRYVRWAAALMVLLLTVTSCGAAEGVVPVFEAETDVIPGETEDAPPEEAGEAMPVGIEETKPGIAGDDAITEAVESQPAEIEMEFGEAADVGVLPGADPAQVVKDETASETGSEQETPPEEQDTPTEEQKTPPEEQEAPPAPDEAIPTVSPEPPSNASEAPSEDAGTAAPVPPEVRSNAKRIPVLTYHKVLTDAEKNSPRYAHNRFTVSLSKFTRQMRWLSRKHYTAITCEQLYLWRKGKIHLPRRSVLITFDDGYASTIENVIPVLEACGLRGTAFIIGAETNRSNGSVYISSSRLREIQAEHPCIEFQSHTWGLHKQNAYKTEAYASFAADAARQHEAYGFEYLAYPYGKRCMAMTKAYRKNGIKMAFLFGTRSNGYATRHQNLFKIKRIEVTGGMSFRKFKQWCS